MGHLHHFLTHWRLTKVLRDFHSGHHSNVHHPSHVFRSGLPLWSFHRYLGQENLWQVWKPHAQYRASMMPQQPMIVLRETLLPSGFLEVLTSLLSTFLCDIKHNWLNVLAFHERQEESLNSRLYFSTPLGNIKGLVTTWVEISGFSKGLRMSNLKSC